MDDPPDAAAPGEPAPGLAAGPDTLAADPPSEAPAGGGRWPLRRSVRDRKLKGVAAGVAVAADLDPTLVRLLFVVAAFSGWGIVAYIVLAVVLQDEIVEDPARPLPREPRRNLRIGLGVAAVVAMGRFLDGWFFGGDMGLPFLLVAAGAAVLWARRDQTPPVSSGSEPPLSAPVEGWASTGTPHAWPTAAPAPPRGAGIDWRSTGHDLLRLAAAFVAVGALLALIGGAFLVIVGAVPMRLPFLPATVGVVGLLALVVAVVRRAKPAGLFISGGVLVAAAALAVGLASFPGTAGNRVVVIGPNTPLQERYQHSAGRLVLDLRDLPLEAGRPPQVVAKVGIGELTVIVPAALSTDVRAEVGAGNATLFGRQQSGPGMNVSGSHAGAEGGNRLDLDLDVGVGQIRVELAPEPTFDVRCEVPPEATGDGSDAVRCPHPAKLEGQPMSCSVALSDPEGTDQAGQAFCRLKGFVPPKVGLYGVSCEVPAERDEAGCAPLSSAQLKQLGAAREARARAVAPTTTAGPGTPPSLVCGPPDATGERLCSTAPVSSTSTTAAPSYRCREDPTTRQLTCVPS